MLNCSGEVYDSTETGYPGRLILQAFCSLSWVLCFSLSRISSELTKLGERHWKFGITIANFIPLEFAHLSYKQDRWHCWDVKQGLFFPKFPHSLPHFPQWSSSKWEKMTSQTTENESNPCFSFSSEETKTKEESHGGTPDQWVSVLPSPGRERDLLDQMKGGKKGRYCGALEKSSWPLNGSTERYRNSTPRRVELLSAEDLCSFQRSHRK